MAIIGLTDKAPALPRIGQLRKGGKKPEKGIGKDLHFFRFVSDDEDTAAAFARWYGNQPNGIRILLPYRTVEENLFAWKQAYTAGALQHRCDRNTCVLWRDEDGSMRTDPKPCPGGCKYSGILEVIIPQLGRLATVSVITGSINDIINIHANLLWLQTTNGSLQGIPLILRRVEREISTPRDGGKRTRAKKWLIQIEAEQDWVRLQLEAHKQQALTGMKGLLSAAPPEILADVDSDEDNEDDDEIPTIDASIQTAPDQKILLFESLLNVWVAIGKHAEDWPNYRKERLDGQSIAQLKKLLTAWEKKAGEMLDDVHPGQIDENLSKDELVAAIDRQILGLRAENVQDHEFMPKVMKITSGQEIVDCDIETLTGLLACLEEWNEGEKVPMAKTA